MKRMINTEKFLDKLLYMGYMDEQKSEVEEIANSMTEDAYSKDEVIDMLKELKKEIDAMSESVVKDGRMSVEIISFGGGIM